MTGPHEHHAPECSPLLHSRRGIVVALGAAAMLSAGRASAADASPEDERFMRLALDEAQQAARPFGA